MKIKHWPWAKDVGVVTTQTSTPVSTATHEIGHTFGLCHNLGVEERQGNERVCRTSVPRPNPFRLLDESLSFVSASASPQLADVVTSTAGLSFHEGKICPNDRQPTARSKFMNYCQPHTYFPGDPTVDKPESDEYPYLKGFFQDEGWIE